MAACPVAVNVLPRPAQGANALPQLDLRKVDLVPKSWSKSFPKQVTFSIVEVYPIEWSNKGFPAKSGNSIRGTYPSEGHGTLLDPSEEYYKAIRRAVELSSELANGTTVIVGACPKSPRSSICKVQPTEWLVDTGSGHDLIDLALVMRNADLINTDHQNLTLSTANGECKPAGSIAMRIEALGEVSSALVLENTPNVLSVGLRCMDYGYAFHWPSGRFPYWVTPEGKHVPCRVENNVPFLNGVRHRASPAHEVAQAAEVSDACALASSGQDLPTPIPDHLVESIPTEPSSGENLSTLEARGTPLTAAALAAAPPGAQKYMLRDSLVKYIREFQPLRAESLTDTLLHEDNCVLLDLLRSPDVLKARVNTLLNHERSLAGTACGEHLPTVCVEHEPVIVAPAAQSSSSSARDAPQATESDLECSDVEPEDEELSGRRNLRAESTSVEHMLTHRPLNKYCNACRRCKAQRKPCKRGASSGYYPAPKEFGDSCTCDHIIAYDEMSKGINGEEEALAIKDLATGWIFGYPVKSKSTPDVVSSIGDFVGPYDSIRLMHSDPAPELRSAFGELNILFEPAPTGIKGNNGIAERLVRTLLDGSRTLLEHSGLPLSFWPLAMRCFSILYNVTHLLEDSSTPWSRRHGQEFNGELVPFGALVNFMPSPEELKRQPKFAPRAIPGVFLGYELSPGGAWKKVYIVASLEDCRSLVGPRDAHFRCPHLHRTRELVLDVPFVPEFPLKAAHDRATRTLHADSEGAGSAGVHTRDVDTPLVSPTEPQLDTYPSLRPSVSEGGGSSPSPEEVPKKNDPLQKPKGKGTVVGGIPCRDYAGSSRNSDIDTLVWRSLSPPIKEELKKTFAKYGKSFPTQAEREAVDKALAGTKDQAAASAPCISDRDIEAISSEIDDNEIDHLHLSDTVGNLSMSELVLVDETLDGEVIAVPSCGVPYHPPRRVEKRPAESSIAAMASPATRSYGSSSMTQDDKSWNNRSFPRMPVFKGFVPNEHRDHTPFVLGAIYACVARPVTKRERQENADARASLAKEWGRLRKITTWDESIVREWEQVALEARRSGKIVHVGRIFDICVEKGSELPKGDPARKFKGRVVFQGNNVRDQNWEVAMFQDLSSCPATMEAGKACDFYGSLAGHVIQQSDAEQAYTQSRLGGDPTWVRLPKEQWPESWKGMRDPVCPLRLALYGHPDSGGYWEQHCEAHLVDKVGFVPIEEWRSCFWHPKWKMFLVVYVDDFKLAGPEKHMAECWHAIRSGIKTDDPSPVGKYLGCDHKVSTQMDPSTGHEYRIMEYDMSDFMRSCVDRYVELAGINKSSLRKALTPFLVEPKEISPARDPCSSEDAAPPGSVDEVRGRLQPIAARVLMKVLYGARMARYDLIRAVNGLATEVTKWTPRCDARLHRLMCYINSTLEQKLYGWVGDSVSNLSLHLFVDADLAGDQASSRSTSGVFFAVFGPRTRWPLTGQSKKQTAVSHSTPEAEIVAYDLGLRTIGLPATLLWSTILGHYGDLVMLHVKEDNEAMIKVLTSGRNPTMRYLSRTHGIDVRWLFEVSSGKFVKLEYTKSEDQAADIFTKPFEVGTKWSVLIPLVNMSMPNDLWDLVRRHSTHFAAGATLVTTDKCHSMQTIGRFFSESSYETRGAKRCLVQVYDPLPDRCMIGFRTEKPLATRTISFDDFNDDLVTDILKLAEAVQSTAGKQEVDLLIFVNDFVDISNLFEPEIIPTHEGSRPVGEHELEASAEMLMSILEGITNRSIKVIIECTSDTIIWNEDRIDRLVKLGFVVVGIQPPPYEAPIVIGSMVEQRCHSLDRIGLHLPAFLIMSPAVASLVSSRCIADVSFESIFDAWIEN